jgi:DNA-binding winged helix-turn-helix (wHTH) protein
MNGRWALGPYVLDSAGTLDLDGGPVPLKPQQHLVLRVLVEQGGLVSRDQLSARLWPDGPPRDPGALAQVIHGLRRVLDRGPLGGQVLRTVYGKGYAYVGPLAPLPGDPGSGLASPAAEAARGTSRPVAPSILHREAWARWRCGDPLQLSEVVRLLSDCLALDPLHLEALVDLCHCRLLQAGWGLACTRSTGQELQGLLGRARALGVEANALAALHAETLTTLFWQSDRSDQLYSGWLPQHLPLDRPLLGWVRHLLYSGQADRALDLLNARLQDDLPQGWGLKAYAHIQRGEWPEAEAASRWQMRLRGNQAAAPPLELALAVAQQGNADAAADLVEQCAILGQRQLTSLHALAALTLARGPQRTLAAGLLRRASRQHERLDTPLGAPSLWGAAALALGESALATRLLTAAVRERCGMAPIIWHGTLLLPYLDEPAVVMFRRRMARACAQPGGPAAAAANNSNKI